MNALQQIKKAEQLAQAGQIDLSIDLLKNIIKKYPKQAQAQGLLGLLYVFKKNDYLAEQHLLTSLSINFNVGVAKNLVTLFMQKKQWNNAYTWSNKLVAKTLHDVDTQLNHAVILRNINMYDDAIAIYDGLIQDNPQYLNAYISYGFTLNQLKRYQAAIDIYQKGLSINPHDYNLLYNIGITYLNDFDYNNSLKYLNLALEKNNQSLDLWLTIAVCQAKIRDFNGAFRSIEQARTLDPNNLLVPFQMATTLMLLDKNHEAMSLLDQIIKKEPEHVEANYHKGLIYLKWGMFSKGLSYYRYRVKRIQNRIGRFNDFELPKLNKESEIIISREQGIGDEILYLGLIKNIQTQVKSIIYIAQDKLCEWVKLNLPDTQVIKESESEPFIQEHHNLTPLNIASLMSYINDWDIFFNNQEIWKVDQKLREKYLQKYKRDNQRILGISWISANKKIGDEKSIPLKQLAKVINNQKTISLQYGDVQDEIHNINQENHLNIIHDDELDYFNDLNSLAALISVCDRVVTCSNVTAHIAGRLGIKTYLLIPKFVGNIWYWNTTQNTSSWYPSVRIYKQTDDMSWDVPINLVKKDLNDN